MLQIGLVTSLLASSAPTGTPPALGPSLIARIPQESKAQLLVGDLASMMTAETPGPAIRMLKDERLSNAFNAAVDPDGDRVTSVRDAMLQDLGPLVHCAAVGVLDGEDDTLIVASVAEGFDEAFHALTEADEASYREVIAGGRTFLVSDDKGSPIVTSREGHLWACWTGELTDGEDIASQFAYVNDALQEPSAPDQAAIAWAQEMDASLDELVVAMRAPLGEIFEEEEDVDPDMAEFFAGIKATASLRLGHGPEDTLVFAAGIEYQASEKSATLADAFAPARPELLNLAPPEAISASSFHLDIPFLVDAIIDFAESRGEEGVRDQYEAGLDAASSFLGIDVKSDLLDNLTGDFFGMQWSVMDFAAITGPDSDAGALVDWLGVLGFTIQDSEPFYSLIELGETYVPADMLTTGEAHGFELWTVAITPDVQVSVALSDNAVAFGESANLDKILARMDAENEDSFMTPLRSKVTSQECPGFFAWVGEIQPFHDALNSLNDEFLVPLSGDAGGETVTDLMDLVADTLHRTVWLTMDFESDRFEVKIMAR